MPVTVQLTRLLPHIPEEVVSGATSNLVYLTVYTEHEVARVRPRSLAALSAVLASGTTR